MNTINHRECIERAQERTDIAAASPISLMAAMLDHMLPAQPGSPVPSLWHWADLLSTVPTNAPGIDGHAKNFAWRIRCPIETPAGFVGQQTQMAPSSRGPKDTME